jgi:hypothetical protein
MRWLTLWLLVMQLSWGEVLQVECLPQHCLVRLRLGGQWQSLRPLGRWFELPPVPTSGELEFEISSHGYHSKTLTVEASQLSRRQPAQLPLDGSRIVLAPRVSQVTFNTQPSSAQIYLLLPGGQREYLGLSGQPILLNQARFAQGGNQSLRHLEFIPLGGTPSIVPIPAFALLQEQAVIQWPLQGRISLKKGPDWGSWALAGLGVAVSLLVFFRRGSSPQNIAERRGIKIGPYRLLERIGQGASGTVYRCVNWDSPPGATRVLKVLPGKNLEEVMQEARCLTSFHHPNIVKVLDWGEDLGRPYLVTEWFDGQDLRHVISAGQLPERQARQILEQILLALAHAHERGHLHGDLKPENVCVDSQGKVNLIDFGLSLGTPGYQSPEQLQGRLCAASDLYSVGKLAQEISDAPALLKWAQWLTQEDLALRCPSATEALRQLAQAA